MADEPFDTPGKKPTPKQPESTERLWEPEQKYHRVAIDLSDFNRSHGAEEMAAELIEPSLDPGDNTIYSGNRYRTERLRMFQKNGPKIEMGDLTMSPLFHSLGILSESSQIGLKVSEDQVLTSPGVLVQMKPRHSPRIKNQR
jgi:hypothetical protein